MSDNIAKHYANRNEQSETTGSNFNFNQEEAENRLLAAGQRAGEIFEEVKNTVSENYSRAENAIKNYPFLSAAAAFITGIAIAKIFGSSRD